MGPRRSERIANQVPRKEVVFAGVSWNAKQEEGAGIAFIHPRGRPRKGTSSRLRKYPVSKKPSTRTDFVWEAQYEGKKVKCKVHIVECGLPLRLNVPRMSRRGVMVQSGEGILPFIPRGTMLPGAILGYEYTDEEIDTMKKEYEKDRNVMWAIEHSLVEVSPRSERHRREVMNCIVPDMKASGWVILINDSPEEPNCRMVSSVIGQKMNRARWRVDFMTIRDVKAGEYLQVHYEPYADGEARGANSVTRI